jgi:ADP-heptose:LPS heptosyltransferase
VTDPRLPGGPDARDHGRATASSGGTLVVRSDNDGDVLLAGPAVRAVAAAGRRVVLLAGPRGGQAAQLLPGVDEVVLHALPWIDLEPAAVDAALVGELVETLRATGCDEAVVLTSYHQCALPLALLLRVAGVGRVVAASDEYPGSLLDVRHRPDPLAHEVERNLALVADAGYALPAGDDGRLAVRQPLPPPPAEVEDLLATGPAPVVVHPSASVPARRWPADRARELVAALVASGRPVVVTGGPGEEPLTAFVAGPDAVDLGGRTSFGQLATVLARASCVVAGNTGPAHLAAAVGTPVVSLFAPVVSASAWAPYGVPVVLLGDQDAACRGTRARQCPVPGHPCLASVSVDDVLGAVEELAPLTAGVPA